jgi:CubicO group peptidase (beta-lactamase class C family)
VSDKVISFSSEYLPDTVSQFLAGMEIKDLLCMSAGHTPDPTHTITVNDTNWVKAFLALPVVNDPGTKFLYNSMATYMLSAIVQKVTGEKVIDYLTPRLFAPLGIRGNQQIVWCILTGKFLL